MTLKYISGPDLEPITLDEAKAQCRVSSTDEDDLLTALIIAARQECEHKVGRMLISQVWEQVFDAFPSGAIDLDMAGATSVVSVTYVDTAGALQTYGSANYVLDAECEQESWLHPAAGTTWPSTYDSANAVHIRFVVGFGPSASDVPRSVRTWLLMRVGTLYQCRTEISSGAPLSELPMRFTDGLLDRYRVLSV